VVAVEAAEQMLAPEVVVVLEFVLLDMQIHSQLQQQSRVVQQLLCLVAGEFINGLLQDQLHSKE
jgi:hypothetical protein